MNACDAMKLSFASCFNNVYVLDPSISPYYVDYYTNTFLGAGQWYLEIAKGFQAL